MPGISHSLRHGVKEIPAVDIKRRIGYQPGFPGERLLQISRLPGCKIIEDFLFRGRAEGAGHRKNVVACAYGQWAIGLHDIIALAVDDVRQSLTSGQGAVDDPS